jgi:hypothetical protein
MTVVYSEKLSEIVDAKIASGLLKHVRKVALFYERMHTDYASYCSHDHLGRLLNLIRAKHGLPCNFTIAASQRSQRRWEVFVFDCDEPTAVDLVESKVKRGNLGRKVKVKMVLDRLMKTHRWVTGFSDRPAVSRDLLTEEGLQKAAEGYNGNGQLPWYLREIKNVLDREDFDESIYDEAWELFKVQQVMAA